MLNEQDMQGEAMHAPVALSTLNFMQLCLCPIFTLPLRGMITIAVVFKASFAPFLLLDGPVFLAVPANSFWSVFVCNQPLAARGARLSANRGMR